MAGMAQRQDLGMVRGRHSQCRCSLCHLGMGLTSTLPPSLERRQTAVIAGHNLAKCDLDQSAAIPTPEPGTHIIPICRALQQIDIPVYAAATAVAGQLETMLEQIPECLESDGLILRRHGVDSPKLPSRRFDRP